MKKLAFLLATIVIAAMITVIKDTHQTASVTQHKPAPVEDIVTPKAAAKAPEKAPEKAEEPAPEAPAQPVEQAKPPSTQASQPLTCREAIDAVWPTALRDGAKIVLVHENRSEEPHAVGGVNPDQFQSRDYGCFQINDHWHPAYFNEGDWRDPKWAAEYAYKIYQGRQASEGNGWRAWYAVEGILW